MASDGGTTSLAQDGRKRKSLATRIVNARRYILVVCTVVALVSGFMAPNLLSVVKDQVGWEVAAGTPSEEEMREFREYFPDLPNRQTESILISCSNCPALVEDDAAKIVKTMVVNVNRTVTRLNATGDRGYFQTVMCYYDYLGVVEPNPLISYNGKTMLYQWTWTVPDNRNREANELSLEIVGVALAAAETPEAKLLGIEVKAAGPFATHRDVWKATQKDCIQHAMQGLPFVLLLLCCRVGSLSLMVLTLLSAVGSVLTSFAVVSVLGEYLVINSTAPMMMTFFTFALSVDYSLFFLTRYAQQRSAGATWRPAVESMITHMGEVVLLSGSMISLASSTMVFLPGSGFCGAGLAVCTACFSCMMWNYLLIPAIIATAPGFFDACSSWKGHGRVGMTLEDMEASPDLMEQHLVRSPWYWWASKITVWPVNLLVVISVLLIGMPLTAVYLTSEPSMDMAIVESRGSPSTVANHEVSRLFSPGSVYVMVKPKPSMYCPPTVDNNAYFKSSCALAQQIKSATVGSSVEIKSIWGVQVHPDSLTSASPQVSCLPWDDGMFNANLDAHSFLTGTGLMTGFEAKIRGIYKRAWSMLVSEDRRASVIAITTQDLSTPSGFVLVEIIRKILADVNSRSATDTSEQEHGCQVEAYMVSGPSMVYDFMTATFNSLHSALACVMGVSLVLVGFMFKAPFVPVKLILTVVAPIFMSYGAAVGVYQFGWLDGLGVESLAKTSGLSWQIPVGAGAMLFGLGLDYDILVFSRVRELRKEGYGNRDAIRLGLAGTFGTIATAGFIFVMEFSGALFSTVPNNNQMGLVIAFAVLFDIAIMQASFVPALLSIYTDLNWWPMSMPTPSREVVSASFIAEMKAEDEMANSNEEGHPLLEVTDSEPGTGRHETPKRVRVDLPYKKGEQIEVWSSSRREWLEGCVVEAFDRNTFFENYAIKAGTFKVSCSTGMKFVSPDKVQEVIRKGRGYKPGDRIQVWSGSAKEWLDGQVDEAFDRDCWSGEFAVKAGTLKVSSSAGTKWVSPDKVKDLIRRID